MFWRWIVKNKKYCYNFSIARKIVIEHSAQLIKFVVEHTSLLSVKIKYIINRFFKNVKASIWQPSIVYTGSSKEREENSSI